MSIKKKELVEKLKEDCEIITTVKLPKALENNNEGTYRNLVKALEANLNLIERFEFDTIEDDYSVSVDYRGNCIIKVCVTKPNVTRTHIEEIFKQIVHDAKWLR